MEDNIVKATITANDTNTINSDINVESSQNNITKSIISDNNGENILETTILPVNPRTQEHQQYLLYVPVATAGGHIGISSYYDDDFIVNDEGFVKLALSRQSIVKQFSDVNTKLDDEITRATNSETTLNSKIEDEISRAIDVENNLQKQINDLNTNLDLDRYYTKEQSKELFVTNTALEEKHYATEDYVNLNGGKIDVIKVNGVHQEIVDKTIELTIPSIEGLASETFVNTKTQEVLIAANKHTDDRVSGLIGQAPETLDTLKEIADALAEDQTALDTLNLAIGNKVNKTLKINGKTLEQDINLTAADVGALSSFTETDPTVPAWAKEPTKPSYNYSEINNTPTIPTVNNSTVTVKQGGATKGSFTLNQSDDITIELDAGEGGVTIPDNMVTTDTEQTISGSKTFTQNIVKAQTTGSEGFIIKNSGYGYQDVVEEDTNIGKFDIECKDFVAASFNTYIEPNSGSNRVITTFGNRHLDPSNGDVAETYIKMSTLALAGINTGSIKIKASSISPTSDVSKCNLGSSSTPFSNLYLAASLHMKTRGTSTYPYISFSSDTATRGQIKGMYTMDGGQKNEQSLVYYSDIHKFTPYSGSNVSELIVNTIDRCLSNESVNYSSDTAYDLGRPHTPFKNLYLAGGILGQNTTYKLVLPNMYEWEEDKTIATTDQIPEIPTLGDAASKSVVTTVDTSTNLPTSNAVKTFVENSLSNVSIPDNEKITEISTQYIRITDLNAGVYRLTYNGTKYIYYNGSSSTSTHTVTGSTGQVILIVNKYSTSYWHWYYINGTTSLGTLYAGYTSTSSGSYSSASLSKIVSAATSVDNMVWVSGVSQTISSTKTFTGGVTFDCNTTFTGLTIVPDVTII